MVPIAFMYVCMCKCFCMFLYVLAVMKMCRDVCSFMTLSPVVNGGRGEGRRFNRLSGCENQISLFACQTWEILLSRGQVRAAVVRSSFVFFYIYILVVTAAWVIASNSVNLSTKLLSELSRAALGH